MPAVVPDLADQCIIVNGVAKTYAMTGWRVGWMIGPPDVMKAAINFQSHATSNVATSPSAPRSPRSAATSSAVAMMRDGVRPPGPDDARDAERRSPASRAWSRRARSTASRTSAALLGRDIAGARRTHDARARRPRPRRGQGRVRARRGVRRSRLRPVLVRHRRRPTWPRASAGSPSSSGSSAGRPSRRRRLQRRATRVSGGGPYAVDDGVELAVGRRITEVAPWAARQLTSSGIVDTSSDTTADADGRCHRVPTATVRAGS